MHVVAKVIPKDVNGYHFLKRVMKGLLNLQRVWQILVYIYIYIYNIINPNKFCY